MAFAASHTAIVCTQAVSRARAGPARLSSAQAPSASLRQAAPQRLAARSSVGGKTLIVKHSAQRIDARTVTVFAAVKDAKGGSSDTLLYTTPNLGMPVTLSRLPNSRMRLRAEVPLSFCETAYKETLEECKKAIGTIDGYRKGAKVPAKIIVREVGKDVFLNKIGEFIISGTLVEASQAVAATAMQDSERVVTPPLDIISNFSGPALEPQGPSIYEFEVDTFPELQWKGDYRKLSVSVEAAGDSVSEAKEVEELIRLRQKELSALRVVTDRGLEVGDTVVLNVDAFRVNPDGTDGEPLQFATMRRLRMDTSEELDIIPGFVEALKGMKVNDERSFDLILPQNIGRDELRGVKARFRAILLELFGRTLEPLSDELAPKLMGGCTSMQQVRDQLLQLQKMATTGQTQTRVRDALALALGDIAQVELPASLVQESGRESYSAELLERQAKGLIQPEVVRQLLAPAMVQKHIDKNREKIERNVRCSLALGKLAEELKLAPSDEQLAEALAETRKEFASLGQEFDEERLKSEITEAKVNEMALEWLEKNNKVTITPHKA